MAYVARPSACRQGVGRGIARRPYPPLHSSFLSSSSQVTPPRELSGFLLWGHASAKFDQFLEMVHKVEGLTVHHIVRKPIDQLEKFVMSIYEPDLERLGQRHIMDKTKYLMKVPPSLVFVVPSWR